MRRTKKKKKTRKTTSEAEFYCLVPRVVIVVVIHYTNAQAINPVHRLPVRNGKYYNINIIIPPARLFVVVIMIIR